MSLPPLRRHSYGGQHMWWHDSIIDLMLAHPEWTKKQIAAALGVTPQIIYLVTGSDLFRAKWEQRRREFSEHHDGVILAKLTAVAESSLDILAQALDKKKDSIPVMVLADIADKTLNRLGYGARPGPTPAVQVNVGAQQAVVSVSADELNEARQALRNAERQRLVGRIATEGCGAIAVDSAAEGGGAFAEGRTAAPSDEVIDLTAEGENVASIDHL